MARIAALRGSVALALLTLAMAALPTGPLLDVAHAQECRGAQGGSDEGVTSNSNVTIGPDGKIVLRASQSEPACNQADPNNGKNQTPVSTGPALKCTFQDLTGLSYPTTNSDPVADQELAAKRDAGQRFIYESCTKPDGTSPTFRGYWVDPSVPAGGGAIARGTFEEAAKTVRLPGPKVRTFPPPERQVVNVETWLHVDSDLAAPIPFTSPFSADVSTTNVLTSAQATATRVVWNFGGDAKGTPNPVECRGAGEVWVSGASENDPDRCPVRFYKSGSGTATVTIYYSVFWVGTTGEYGWAPTERTSAPFAYEVRGYEAVIR